jgi:energy-coupling factor transporter ATP-binding protein EcfA2
VTVLEFVLSGRFVHGGAFGWETDADVEQATRALAECDLGGYETRLMNRLSGGERQRVVLARALAASTKVLLLDEPTANLDLAHQAMMFKLVSERCRKVGASAVVITHDLNLASEFAEHGLASTAMRIFNMYGPGQDDRLVIPRFIRSALAGTDLAINGDGAQTRDFIYVDDVVDAMLASTGQTKGYDTINVCSGREVSICDLAAMIIRLVGSRSSIAFRPSPAERAAFEQARCFGNREKMERLPGIRAAISIEDGLRRTIASMASAI